VWTHRPASNDRIQLQSLVRTTEGFRVKIVSITTKIVSIPMEQAWVYGLGSTTRKDELWVLVDTDEDLRGVGVSYHGHAAPAIEAIVERQLAPRLTGRDPLEIQEIWDVLFGSNFHLGAAAAMAISGIDIALWDLLGKVANLPLYKLLGGAGTPRLPLYVGCMTLGIQSTDSLVAEATSYANAGYRALKLRGGAGVEADERAVRAVREALPDIDIMVDANCSYAYGDAIELGRRLALYSATWLEDPFDYAVPFHHSQMGRLSQASPTPIASGGSLYTRFELQSLLEAGGCHYITPDVVKCGGISEAMKMAAMASAAGILVAPHTVAGLAGIANAHFTAAIPSNARSYMEWDPTPSALQRELLKPTPVVTDGLLNLPPGPGLGIDLDLDRAESYPPVEKLGISDAPRGEGQRLLRQYGIS
jgi:D-galactarolactone cycloisomerase